MLLNVHPPPCPPLLHNNNSARFRQIQPSVQQQSAPNFQPNQFNFNPKQSPLDRFCVLCSPRLKVTDVLIAGMSGAVLVAYQDSNLCISKFRRMVNMSKDTALLQTPTFSFLSYNIARKAMAGSCHQITRALV
mmetsp:Transcript_63262/g.105343  ORF Transcript_63262/g.105343 Transcript_63262/m.105343 type:complete len:133 (+) Transcript_63262:371-769(+)